MNIIEVKERTPILIKQLVMLWEASVKATHPFLSEAEIQQIKQYVPEALAGVPTLVIAENDSHQPVGFMGIADHHLEMLFVAKDARGQGLGKQLLNYGLKAYGINELAVNEQNPLAKGFYEHLGFEIYRRSELDEQGNPYPLLYMRRGSSGK